MTFDRFNRRLHLYLGLSLLPWFFVYGVSSAPFSHAQYFNQLDKAKGLPDWTPRFERPYDVPVPEGGNLRTLAARIVKDAGIDGAFGAYRLGPNRINVYVHTFWRATQIQYRLDEKKLVAEDRRFRWDHFLTGLHARGGFEQEGLLQNSWSVVVDLVSLGMPVWIASGIYMWWNLRPVRRWGWLALGAGCASFAFFLATL